MNLRRRPPARPLAGLLAALALGAAGLGAATAWAATANGVTPVAPAAGEVVPRATAPTFSTRASGGGEVFFRVCRSAERRRSDGLICAAEAAGRARRGEEGRLYLFRPKVYAYPDYWLNRPGTYFWQAHRIRCEDRRVRDCRQEGPVVEIRVR